jgi:hypothetical protein
MASLERPADEAYVARGRTNLLGTLRTDQAARERAEVLDARRNRDDIVDDDEEQVQSSGGVTDFRKPAYVISRQSPTDESRASRHLRQRSAANRLRVICR